MLYFCFLFLCFKYYSIDLSVSFVVVCLLHCLSHHLQGRVHDSDPMGGHDSDPSVGPGYVSSTRRGVSFLFFALFLSLFRSIYLLLCSCSVSLYVSFVFVCFFILLLWFI